MCHLLRQYPTHKSFIFDLYAAELGHTRKVWNFEKRRSNTTKGAQWKTLWCASFSMCTIADCSASAKGFPSFTNPVNRNVLKEMLYH
jgi:hypothetical protein